MNTTREVLVGTIFLIGIILLGIFTITVSDYSPFRKETQLRIRFDDVRGLKVGNEVRAAGVEIGKVRKVELEDGAAIVTIGLFRELAIYENAKFTIESVSPLGGKFVSIDTGAPPAPKADLTTVLPGEAPPEDVTNALNKLLKDIREGPGTISMLIRDDEVYNNIKNFTDFLSQVATDVKDGKNLLGKLVGPDSEKLYAQLEDIVSAVRDAAEQVRQKKGTLGKVIYDDALYDQLDAASKSVQTLAANLEAGKGTVGKLLTDEELYNSIRDIVRSIESGEGALGQLITDEDMGREIREIVSNLNSIAESIESGEGTLGMLMKDRTMYDDAVRMVASLKEAAENIASNKGTIGKLINDPTLYSKVDRLVTELTEATEDAREAAPITAFATVLLAGFR